MISPRKLSNLPRSQRLRKILKLFLKAEREVSGFAETQALGETEQPVSGEAPPSPSGGWRASLADLAAAMPLLVPDTAFPPERLAALVQAHAAISQAALDAACAQVQPARTQPQTGGSCAPAQIRAAELRRAINTVRHILLAETGQSQADWDFLDAANRLDCAKRRAFSGMMVYLEDIRSPFNVGSMFRIAESFGAERITLSPLAADPLHPRAQRTARGCVDAVPWERGPLPAAPVFAMETGGVPLKNFPFPKNGVMIAGSEELGVSPAALARADASLGRLSIPTYGAKGSLNVSSAFAIAMQAGAAALAEASS